jgi:uncharacterized protein (TIGR00159 family)
LDNGFDIGFLSIRWVDLIDVGLVSFLLYQLYKLMKGSVAFRIAMGFVVIYVTFLVVRVLQMELLTSILEQFIKVGGIAVVVLFQQEIRKFLLMVGRSTFMKSDGLMGLLFKRKVNQQQNSIQPIIDAAKAMSNMEIGALIVFSKTDELKFYEESGDMLDAVISKRLLISIFTTESPLHDGAVMIRNGRIRAARCILPVTDNTELPAQYGLRHRAALGLSEVTDAVVLIISEETGQISLAHEGILETNLSAPELRSKLLHLLFDRPEHGEVHPPMPVKQEVVSKEKVA